MPFDALLDVAIEHFGYVARDVFNAMFYFNAMTVAHKKAVQISHRALQEIIAAFARGDSVFDPHIYHWILVIRPITSGHLLEDRWALNFKSDMVGRSMPKQLHVTGDIIIRQKINIFRQMPQTAALAGWYFEPLAHCQLVANSSCLTWANFTLSGIGDERS
ncbi:hypothetical protein BU17DRAFT_92638 [Hysterangium stoloniferum]|nr:hypothetical protein BU17DRAFT_92638 [Hysterangium stoloniferum]